MEKANNVGVEIGQLFYTDKNRIRRRTSNQEIVEAEGFSIKNRVNVRGPSSVEDNRIVKWFCTG